MNTIENLKLHFKWTIGLGCIILISIVTFWLGGKGNEIVSYVSFASALISIVLALVAIFYSFIQTINSQKNLGEMQSLITQASKIMSEKADTMVLYTAHIANLTQNMARNSTQPPLPTKHQFKFYAATCSHIGILALYCLAKTASKKKPMSLLKIIELLANGNTNARDYYYYSMGVLIGFSCFMEQGVTNINIDSQLLTTDLEFENYIRADINRRISDPLIEVQIKDTLNNCLKQIDAYFGSL
ncbi:MAG: hypothetical protein A2Y10_15835 [Planctomycetes bacterium GWF2_41_51]|nr:MAG: hypothetical protein A2Y10_15835 [Planctomycetes bacterium GWF2_41_51]HBG27597.1 hypothetical protein [Phycisphaerales bacterium]